MKDDRQDIEAEQLLGKKLTVTTFYSNVVRILNEVGGVSTPEALERAGYSRKSRFMIKRHLKIDPDKPYLGLNFFRKLLLACDLELKVHVVVRRKGRRVFRKPVSPGVSRLVNSRRKRANESKKNEKD